jgi:hypothetical protein
VYSVLKSYIPLLLRHIHTEHVEIFFDNGVFSRSTRHDLVQRQAKEICTGHDLFEAPIDESVTLTKRGSFIAHVTYTKAESKTVVEKISYYTLFHIVSES